MTFVRVLSAGLVLGSALLTALVASGAPVATSNTAPLTCGLPDATQQDALDKARELMPGALARQIRKHRRALMAGVRQARADGAPHLQSPLQEDGTAARLAESMARVTALLDAQRPMKDVVRELGVVAHLVADLSNPFLGVDDEEGAELLGPRFESYLADRRDRFRVVFEGYGHPLLEDLRLEAFGRSLADRSRSYLDDVIGAFRRYDAGEDSRALDDRSIAFGVASLTYSRSVTDTARAWLHAWKAANGDMTGLPYPLEESSHEPTPPPGAGERLPQGRHRPSL